MPESYPRPTPIRLAFSALFWRLMLGLTLLFSIGHGRMLVQRVRPGQRLVLFCFSLPMLAALAFTVAAGLTVIADLLVRLVVRPTLESWLSPRVGDESTPFHLAPTEREVASTPARLASGRAWSPGRLVLTDRRIVFLPNAWDREPWSAPLGKVEAARPVAAPPAFWGLIRNIPPRLEIVETGEPPRRFALADAHAWAYAPGPAPLAASSPVGGR